MNIPAFIILFIAIIWLQYEIRKASRKTSQNSNRFWDKEQTANQTRRTDINQLEYLSVTKNHLPLEDKDDATINSYRDIILGLIDKKILNLTGYTNTELKTKYGAANLTQLIEYDNNYTILVSTLQKWAERLYQKGYTADAVIVLEYGIVCQTDVVKTYRLLAEIYKKQSEPEKIKALIPVVTLFINNDRDRLLCYLEELLHS